MDFKTCNLSNNIMTKEPIINQNYDVLIVGAGVIGSFVARNIARLNLKIGVLEREEDVCCGVSKAHTAIVHCGYSGKPGSIKASMTVKANENFHKVCEELDVEFRRCGSIITTKADKGMKKLEEKLERGRKNGVKGLQLLDREETLKIEPNISDDVIASLYAPTTGIADPWEYCVAAMENAMDNGVELFLNTEVKNMNYINGLEDKKRIKVYTNRGIFVTNYLINCAGLYSDEINNMTEEAFFKISPRKGEYIVLDKTVGNHINGFIFQAREEDAPKGVIVSPTIHGNLMVGPSSEDISDKQDFSNSIEGLEYIKKISEMSVKDIPFDKTISYFAGIRPRPNLVNMNNRGEIEVYEDKVKDFILSRGKKNPNLINIAGIKSPGFTCANEIGKYVYEILCEDYKREKNSNGYILRENLNFNPKRKKRNRIKSLIDDEVNKIIESEPSYGRIICKCNFITKGEIIDVIKRNAGALTVDGVKRRTGASMGKCHGSHCKAEIQKIIDKEISKSKNKPNSSSEIIEEENEIINSKNEIQKSSKNIESKNYEVIIIGGGIAGVSIAINLIEKGIRSLAIVERNSKLGGILNQCIHHGFGVKYLKKNMTGIEYSNYFIKKLIDLSSERKINIDIMTETEALSISNKLFKKIRINRRNKVDSSINKGFLGKNTENKVDRVEEILNLRVLNKNGIRNISTKALVISTGCIEHHIGQIFLSRNRVKGIFTAGEAQRIINIDGKSIGKKVIIIGSGDIGLIMARRLVIEGAEVVAIIEQNDRISGLDRNKSECVDAYGIPIEFSSRIKKILGKDRVEGIEYIKGKVSFKIACDAIITSVGLEPDLSLLEEFQCNINTYEYKNVDEASEIYTKSPKEDTVKKFNKNNFILNSMFILGNSDYVHDLVDDIAIEAKQMADNIIEYIRTGNRRDIERKSETYKHSEIRDYDLVCTVCPESCRIKYKKEEVIGNQCSKGKKYAILQRNNPSRHITTTVKIKDGTNSRVLVKTLKPINSKIISETIRLIKELKIFENDNLKKVELKNGVLVEIVSTIDIQKR